MSTHQSQKRSHSAYVEDDHDLDNQFGPGVQVIIDRPAAAQPKVTSAKPLSGPALPSESPMGSENQQQPPPPAQPRHQSPPSQPGSPTNSKRQKRFHAQRRQQPAGCEWCTDQGMGAKESTDHAIIDCHFKKAHDAMQAYELAEALANEQHDAEIARVTAQLKSQHAQELALQDACMEDMKKTIKEQDVLLENLTAQHLQREEEWRNQLAEEIRHHEDAVNDLQDLHTDASWTLCQEHNATIDDLNDNHTIEMAKLQEQLDDCKYQLLNEADKLAAAQRRIESQELVIEDLDEAHGNALEHLELERELHESSRRKELADKDDELDQRLDFFLQKHNASIADFQAQHTQQLESLRQDLATKDKQLSTLQANFDNLETNLEAQHHAVLTNLRNEHATQLGDLKKELSAKDEKISKLLEILYEQYDRVDELKSNLPIESNSALQLVNLRREHGVQLNYLKEKLAEKTKELADCKDKWEGTLAEQAQRHSVDTFAHEDTERILREERIKLQQKIDDLKDLNCRKDSEHAEVQNQQWIQQMKLQQQYAEAVHELDVERETVKALSEEKARLGELLEEAHSKLLGLGSFHSFNSDYGPSSQTARDEYMQGVASYSAVNLDLFSVSDDDQPTDYPTSDDDDDMVPSSDTLEDENRSASPTPEDDEPRYRVPRWETTNGLPTTNTLGFGWDNAPSGLVSPRLPTTDPSILEHSEEESYRPRSPEIPEARYSLTKPRTRTLSHSYSPEPEPEWSPGSSSGYSPSPFPSPRRETTPYSDNEINRDDLPRIRTPEWSPITPTPGFYFVNRDENEPAIKQEDSEQSDSDGEWDLEYDANSTDSSVTLGREDENNMQDVEEEQF